MDWLQLEQRALFCAFVRSTVQRCDIGIGNTAISDWKESVHREDRQRQEVRLVAQSRAQPWLYCSRWVEEPVINQVPKEGADILQLTA